MILINKNDNQRKYYSLGRKAAEGIVASNHGRLGIPMPALGEVICKIRDKQNCDYEESFSELNRLIDESFFEIKYISDPETTFRIAKRISAHKEDSRDAISPMDALITATAIVNPDCNVLYTTDKRLITSVEVLEIINDEREALGYEQLRISEFVDMLR